MEIWSATASSSPCGLGLTCFSAGKPCLDLRIVEQADKLVDFGRWRGYGLRMNRSAEQATKRQ